MNVYAEVAAKYGRVDSKIQRDVDYFFEFVLPTLEPAILQCVVDELIARDGENAVVIRKREYASCAPLPKLERMQP